MESLLAVHRCTERKPARGYGERCRRTCEPRIARMSRIGFWQNESKRMSSAIS